MTSATIYHRETTVIWDLDGTMLDSFGVYADLMADVLPRHEIAVPSQELLKANYHGSLDESINNALGGIEPVVLKSVISDFLADQDVLYADLDGHLYQDAVQLAGRLHEAGKRQYIVTNRGHIGRLNASPRSIVANSELRQYIDGVICGDDSEHRKPNEAILEPLVSRGVNFENAIVIGDQFVDAQLAHNIGSRAVLVAREGGEVPHLERLADGWKSHVALVDTLDQVTVEEHYGNHTS